MFFTEIRKRVKAILRAEILFVFIFYTTNCFGKQHYKGAIYERMEMVAGDRHPKTAEFGSQIVDTEAGYGMVGTLNKVSNRGY